MACHSYNIVHYKGQKIRIATLDTMLSFYLAFYYVKRPYYDPKRILCMCDYLFKTQEKNRLQQKGLLRRFSMDCYGEEKHTKEKTRAHKSEMYQKLKDKRGSDEWNWYFLNYTPGNTNSKTNKKGKKTDKKTRKKRKGRKKKKTRKRGLISRILL